MLYLDWAVVVSIVNQKLATTVPTPIYLIHPKLRRIMSHEGNDKIIDDERDNLRTVLSQNAVLSITELGIGIVQEIMAETIKRKPGMSVKEFTKILDQYLEKQKDLINAATNK